MFLRLLLLVFASVLLVTAEQSPDAVIKHEEKRAATQSTIRINPTNIDFIFNCTHGSFLSEMNEELVRLTAPSSRSLEVASNQELQYGSNVITLQFMNGTFIQDISDIMTLYVLEQGSASTTPFTMLASTPLSGPGKLYYDSNSAFYSRVPGFTSIVDSLISQYPLSGVIFAVSPETQGAVQVLRLTVNNDESSTMSRDVVQITGSSSVPISSSQSITYQGNTISIVEGGRLVQSFTNILAFTTYTIATGTIPINKTFMTSANVMNTNNPRGFMGPGQLIVESQRAFYTTDGTLINDIQDSTISQTVAFMSMVSNGVITELNLQDRLNMNGQLIQLIDSVAIPLSGVTSYEISGQDVIFRDSNNITIIRALGRDQFSIYNNNQVRSFSLPGSDRTEQIQGSASGALYSNSDTNEVFYSNDQFLNQRIDQMLRQATDTPPAAITSIQYRTNSQRIGSLFVNGMSVITLSGALIIDIGQRQSIEYSDRKISVRGNSSTRQIMNINQLSTIAPPGTFLVFNASADLTFRGPGRLYINGHNAFYTNDNNLTHTNSKFLQNIQPPQICANLMTDDNNKTFVVLSIGGEPYLTLSNGSIITTSTNEVLLYSDNQIYFVRPPVKIPEGATVTYESDTVIFGSSNITGIGSFTVLNGMINTFTGSSPDRFQGGGYLYDSGTGVAVYTVSGVITPSVADAIQTSSSTRARIESITRLGVFDNNQFVMYKGKSPRVIPGGRSLFTSGRSGFYSTDPAIYQRILFFNNSQLNPNGLIVVINNNMTVYKFVPGMATREFRMQNLGTFTYINGTLFNALNHNVTFEPISSVTHFNGIVAQQFNTSTISRNFTGPGSLFIDTERGTAFFADNHGTADAIYEARRCVIDTFQYPMIDRPGSPSFFTKLPSGTAQFGQRVRVYEGTRIVLECRVRFSLPTKPGNEATYGNPHPTIRFFYAGEPNPIMNNDIYTIENGNLTINSATIDDTGRYTCRAWNYLGLDEISTDLTVSPGTFDGCCYGRDSQWNILWGNTARNTIDTQRCPGGIKTRGNATRLCMMDGNWADPNVLECESQQFREILMQAEDVFSSNRTTAEILEGSASLTSQLVVATETDGTSLLPTELNTTNNILSRVIDVLENSVSMGITPPSEAIVDVLSNILEESNVNGWRDLQIVSPGSQVLLDNAERYGLYLARSLNDTNTAQVLSRKNIAVSAKQLSAINMDVSSLNNEVFPIEEDLVNFTQQASSAQIRIPAQILLEAISRSSSDVSIPIAHVLFHNLDEFLPSAVDGLNNSQVVSTVLSSQVGNRQTSGVSQDTLELNPISLTFSFISVNESTKYRCTYWNFSEPIGLGSWVTNGISTTGNMTVGNVTSVQCLSTHLTSFAVLVDVAGGLQNISEVERKALQIVSYIGCAISTICLIIAVVFFLFQGKKLFDAVHMFLHLNLCVSLLLGYLTFMVGIETATSSTGGCALVAALLHYFFLASFCWMMCEGVMLYLKLVVVFSHLSKKWWLYLLLGWVTPLLFVGIAVGSRHQYYGVRDKDGALLFCWMSVEKGTIYAFVVPALVIILINVVFLCFVVRSILKSKQLQQSQEWKKLEVINLAKTTLKATVILLPLLGLTWVFGVLTIDRNTTVFAWLFTICNSIQGTAILFFHVIRNEIVWNKLCSQFTAIHQKTLSSAFKSQKYEKPSSSGFSSKGDTLEAKTESNGYELNTLPKPTTTGEGISVVWSHPKHGTSLSDVPLDKGEAIDPSANDNSPDNSKITMEDKTLEGPH